MQPCMELFADARKPESRTRVQRWKRGLGIYGRGPGSPTNGTHWRAGERKRSCEQERRRHHAGWSPGSQPGRQQAPPSEPPLPLWQVSGPQLRAASNSADTGPTRMCEAQHSPWPILPRESESQGGAPTWRSRGQVRRAQGCPSVRSCRHC